MFCFLYVFWIMCVCMWASALVYTINYPKTKYINISAPSWAAQDPRCFFLAYTVLESPSLTSSYRILFGHVKFSTWIPASLKAILTHPEGEAHKYGLHSKYLSFVAQISPVCLLMIVMIALHDFTYLCAYLCVCMSVCFNFVQNLSFLNARPLSWQSTPTPSLLIINFLIIFFILWQQIDETNK